MEDLTHRHGSNVRRNVEESRVERLDRGTRILDGVKHLGVQHIEKTPSFDENSILPRISNNRGYHDQLVP